MPLVPLLLAVAALSLALSLATQLGAHVVLSRKRRVPRACPPISILKPLKGVDEALFDNLCSFATLDYPGYEVLFGIADGDDPALEVVRAVQRAYPRAALRLLICDRPFGRNPKVSLLATLEKAARNDWVLISDSNVRARPDYLLALASELNDPQVGLVSSVLAGVGEESSGAVLENLQLGSFVASSVASGALVGHACVVGKSMLFRRSALARLGGFRGVRHVLAEDYVLGRRFQRAGYQVALSPHVVHTVNVRWTARRFLERHLRWAQMRRRLNLPAYLGEPLLNPIPFLLALIGCAAFANPIGTLSPSNLATLALAGIVTKIASDLILLTRLRGTGIAATDLPLILVKDVLLLGVWGIGIFRRTICWRGNTLVLTRGSRLLPVRTSAEETALAREAA